jgi:hypothetical protein
MYDLATGYVEVHMEDTSVYLMPLRAWESIHSAVYGDTSTPTGEYPGELDKWMVAPVEFVDVHGAEITIRRQDITRIVRRDAKAVAATEARMAHERQQNVISSDD